MKRDPVRSATTTFDGERPTHGASGPVLLTTDGIKIATRWWSSATGSDAVVVIAHGLTSTKDDPQVVALAAELHADGYEVVTYDSRGHGGSGGTCTLGKLEVADVTAVVEWARGLGERVVLVGASLGAVAVLSYAAHDSSVSGVVTVSSPGEWRLPWRIRSLMTAAVARTAPGRRLAKRKMKTRIGPWMAPQTAGAHLATIECPVVVMHGGSDPIIPASVSLAKGLVEGPLRQLVLVPTMGHAFDPMSLPSIRNAVGRLVERSRTLATDEGR